METLFKDLCYSARGLLKQPGFTAIAIITLALGIGANTAIFSIVKSVLIRSLPYAEPDRLVQFRFYFPAISHEQAWVDARDAIDWREQGQSFERVGIYGYAVLDFSEGDSPEAIYGVRASADLLPALGVQPALGRYFSSDEDQPGLNHVIILSNDLWRRRFGGDAGIVGKTIRANDEDYVVVGVMPPGFNFPLNLPTTAKLPSQQMGYWYPIGLDVSKLKRADASLAAIARLKPGVSLSQAQTEMNVITDRLAHDNPSTNAGHDVRLVLLKDQVVGGVRLTLFILFGAVGMVVLIACGNIANLMLVRADSRRRELAIRQALGASRWRLMRQALIESLLLAGSGGVIGLLLAQWTLPLLLQLSPQAIPRLIETRVDVAALGFTFGVSMIAGLLFGLAPAWRATRTNLNRDLKQASTTVSEKRSVAGRALIVAEVALTLILTLGASLLLNSFVRLKNVDLGFRADRVLAAVVLPPNAKYRDPKSKIELFHRVIEQVEALPGVESAAASDTLPYSGQSGGGQVRVEGRAPVANIDPSLQSEWSNVTDDFLATMGIPLLRGRLLNDHDTAATTPVVVISETAAQRFWPGEDPIGKRLCFGADGKGPWREVVGIVRSTQNAGLDQSPRPHVYAPVEQVPAPANFLLVRSALPTANLVQMVRQAVAAVDSEQPVFLAAPLKDWVGDSIAKQRFGLFLLGLFGALALALSAVGIYGVVSYAAAQRTREIGIRMALGARGRDVLGLVIQQGMKPALLGVGIGLAGAFGLTRLLTSLLYEVRPTDPITFALIALLLTGVALSACLVPARRATKVDPLVALRYE
jgi:putative ABC transport system permease protein